MPETDIRFDREAKPGVSNLLTIYSTLTGQDASRALVADYQGKMYGHLKTDLAEVMVGRHHPACGTGPTS